MLKFPVISITLSGFNFDIFAFILKLVSKTKPLNKIFPLRKLNFPSFIKIVSFFKL